MWPGHPKATSQCLFLSIQSQYSVLNTQYSIKKQKCKELQISFAKCKPQFEPIVINNKLIKVVTSIKLLELNISNDLKWNCHISEIVKKAAT